MKKPEKYFIVFIAILSFLFVASAQPNIVEPTEAYTNNNDTLNVEIETDDSRSNVEVNVSFPQKTLENISLKEDGGNFYNDSIDISKIQTGSSLSITVEDSSDENSTKVTIDREKPEIVDYGPQSPTNLSEDAFLESDNSSSESPLKKARLDISVPDISEPVDYNDNDKFEFPLSEGDFGSLGEYTFEFNVTDEAGNSNIKTSDVIVDYNTPTYNGAINKTANDYVDDTLFVQKDFDNIESGLDSPTYYIDGEDNFQGLEFGEEIDVGSLESGTEYTIQSTVKDNAGNSLDLSPMSFTADLEEPTIDLNDPSTSRINVSQDFLVNGTFQVDSDLSKLSPSESTFNFGSRDEIVLKDIVGKESANKYLSDSEEVDDFGFAIEGDHDGRINFLYNTSKLEDGLYDAEIKIADKAGNSVVEGFEVGVSSEGPVPEDVSVNGSELESGDYIGSEGVVDFDVDWSGVAPANFSYNWEGDGSDGFETVNESSFNYDLGEDNYTLEIEATDYLGNTGSVNFSNVTVDNTVPSLGVERLTSSDWRSSHEVEVSCSREGSPVSQIGIRHSNGTMIKGWDTETEENYTLSEHGENTYNAVCQDEVGLENTEEFTVKVDKKFPEIANTTPEESATGVNVSETLRLDLNTNTTLSGVNSSLTTVNVSPGNITGTTITNQKVEAEVELPFEEYTTFSGTIYDQLNNTKEFETSFTTRDEPEDWTKIAETTNTSREMVLGVTNLDIGKETGRLNLELRESQSIQKIELQRNQSGEASMMVVEDQQRPTTIDERDGETYIYAAVEPRDISNDNITSANLTFHIEEDWVNQLELENPEFVVERFNSDTEEWEKLPTRVENGTEGIELTAETKHFSWFAPGTTQKQKGILDLIKEQLNKARSADLQNYITIFLITFIVAIILYLLYELGYIKLDIINVKIPKINH